MSDAIIWKYTGLANGSRLNGKIKAENKEEALSIVSRMGIKDVAVWREGDSPEQALAVTPMISESASQEEIVSPRSLPNLDPDVQSSTEALIKNDKVFRSVLTKRRETLIFGEFGDVRKQSEELLGQMNGRVKKVKIQANNRGNLSIFIVIEHDVILGENNA